MTPLQETALRDEWYTKCSSDLWGVIPDKKEVADFFIAKMKARDQELLRRIEREAYEEPCHRECEHEYPHEKQIDLKTIKSIFEET